ncbi:hypothetical protein HPB50_021929 [Hyalomma asiaticum]|uniref:Uncharacterized protein n=1 Tax=Hyalomma asiaticum TaxID=266040 RepID=A0ACB7T0W4_HYAAI|nr:hypothetical protein HPB50_021929 [Hyalomma asiaticum]
MSFSGYRVSRPTLDPDFKQARGIATLIGNDVSFVERDTLTYKKGLESMFTEIIPSRALKAHLYILNLYSSPTDRLRNFTKLFTSAALQVKDRPLIVAGHGMGQPSQRDAGGSGTADNATMGGAARYTE